jgi:hypothetical protein
MESVTEKNSADGEGRYGSGNHSDVVHIRNPRKYCSSRNGNNNSNNNGNLLAEDRPQISCGISTTCTVVSNILFIIRTSF